MMYNFNYYVHVCITDFTLPMKTEKHIQICPKIMSKTQNKKCVRIRLTFHPFFKLISTENCDFTNFLQNHTRSRFKHIYVHVSYEHSKLIGINLIPLVNVVLTYAVLNKYLVFYDPLPK